MVASDQHLCNAEEDFSLTFPAAGYQKDVLKIPKIESGGTMLNEKNLYLAGWLCVAAALLTALIGSLGVVSGITQEKGPNLLWLEILSDTVYQFIWVYLLVMLRSLLNQKASFHGSDKHINLLIWITIAYIAFNLITYALPGMQQIRETGLFAALVPLGIIYAVFGASLLRCGDDLFGYLKPFSYLVIATGIMSASVILAIFALITEIVADVILALIFFNSAKLLQGRGSFAGEQA